MVTLFANNRNRDTHASWRIFVYKHLKLCHERETVFQYTVPSAINNYVRGISMVVISYSFNDYCTVGISLSLSVLRIRIGSSLCVIILRNHTPKVTFSL